MALLAVVHGTTRFPSFQAIRYVILGRILKETDEFMVYPLETFCSPSISNFMIFLKMKFIFLLLQYFSHRLSHLWCNLKITGHKKDYQTNEKIYSLLLPYAELALEMIDCVSS